jgi:hypothetical protein
MIALRVSWVRGRTRRSNVPEATAGGGEGAAGGGTPLTCGASIATYTFIVPSGTVGDLWGPLGTFGDLRGP